MHSTSPHALRALLRFNFALRLEAAGCNARFLPKPCGSGPSHVELQEYSIWFQHFNRSCGVAREGTQAAKLGK
ncbi:MAG TPA: hypothetical protein VLG49_08300 [Rhabdochlamydiaceae bacterium]|nr:hypothetical protein [Rhabdochlamydiaceae bacterium]